MNPEQSQVYSQPMPQYYHPQAGPLQPTAPQAAIYYPEMQQPIYNPAQQPQPTFVYQPQPGISSSTTTTQVVQNPVIQQQTVVIAQPGVDTCDCGNPNSGCCCGPCCPCCDDVTLLSEALYIVILVLSILHPLTIWIGFPIIFCRTRALVRRYPSVSPVILQHYKTFAICGWVAYGISLTGYFFILAWPFIIVSMIYGRLVYLALQGYTGQIVIVNQGVGATTVVVQQ